MHGVSSGNMHCRVRFEGMGVKGPHSTGRGPDASSSLSKAKARKPGSATDLRGAAARYDGASSQSSVAASSSSRCDMQKHKSCTFMAAVLHMSLIEKSLHVPVPWSHVSSDSV